MSATTVADRPAREAPAGQPAQRSTLARLSGWCHDHRWLVLLVWLVALVGSNVVAQVAGTNFSSSFTSGNSDSAQVQSLLAAKLPAQAGSPAQVVVSLDRPDQRPRPPGHDGPDLVPALRGLPHVSAVVSPFSHRGRPPGRRDGHIAYAGAPVRRAGRRSAPRRHPEGDRHRRGRSPLPASRSPSAARPSARWPPPRPGSSEGFGIMAAIIIMLLAFGSVVAMGLPIVTALFGIAIAFAVLDLLSHVLTVPDLRPRDDGHDRPGRGHRLRPVRRHPLPPGALRGPRAQRGGAWSPWPPRGGRWCSPAPR